MSRFAIAAATAIEEALKKALPRAVGNGLGRAASLASVSGLTLGPLLAIADTLSGLPFGSPYAINGTFGPGRYCGTVRRAIITRDAAGRPKRAGFRSARSCRVPRGASRPVTMTFAASSPQS